MNLWTVAGKPPMAGNTVGRCRVCNLAAIGLPFSDWVRDTFTDHDKLNPGDIICHACQFLFDESSEILRIKTGKDKPQRMRNYSHIVKDGEWYPLSKGDKARMKYLLLNYPPPQLACLAESGQKHILFRARWNFGAPVSPYIQLEEHGDNVMLIHIVSLLNIIEPMLVVFSKAEIETANYAQHRILKFGLSDWQNSEEMLKLWRDKFAFRLALFLAQKEGNDDRDAQTDSRDADDPVARSATGLQTQVFAQHLGTIPKQHQKRGIHEQPGHVYQPSLFEIERDTRHHQR